jgi:glycosyltransferase involved in cell wall biosynthesis
VDDAHLLIAGDGPCRAELERRITQLGIGRWVHLLGHRSDVDAILRRVDVGVLSSDWEGMPLFVFECMASGTPLIATAVGGLPEVVSDGETGLLVPPRDPAALANTIERVLRGPRLRSRLASAASAHLHRFTIDAVARRFADLYEELAAESLDPGYASRARPGQARPEQTVARYDEPVQHLTGGRAAAQRG